MTNILIDPIIVAIPESDEAEKIKEWFDNLDAWLKEIDSSLYDWYYSINAINRLYEINRNPSFGKLQTWVRKFRLDINLVAIQKRLDAFFRNQNLELENKLKDLEKELEELGYLVEFEPNSINVQPEQLVIRWPETIKEIMFPTLATTCACKHHNKDEFARELNIATLALGSEYKEIQIAATILESLPDIKLDENKEISQSFPLIFTPDDLPSLIDIVELWNKGEEGIRLAIQQNYEPSWRNPLKFRLGEDFIESVRDAKLNYNETLINKIIRTMAAIVADEAKNINGSRLEHARETESGNSPQEIRKSDQAGRWRVTLKKGEAAWRLHYWQIPSGNIIEFQNVKKHDEI